MAQIVWLGCALGLGGWVLWQIHPLAACIVAGMVVAWNVSLTVMLVDDVYDDDGQVNE